MNEFWAALAGAVVGGAISAATAWLTARTQWRRERQAAQLDRLHLAALDLRRAAAKMEKAANQKQLPSHEDRVDLREQFILVRMLALSASPSMGVEIRRFAKRLDEMNLGEDSPTGEWVKTGDLMRELNDTVVKWLALS